MEINIEELHGQIGRRRMLAKGPIICQPDSVAELLICAKYQQLIMSDLNLSTDAEMGGQRNGDTLIQKILSIHPSKERLKMNLFLLNKLTLFHL